MMLLPVSVDDRTLLGFANTAGSLIVCFYADSVTCFSAEWAFHSEKQLWNVCYTEQEWKEAPLSKPSFENNTDSLKRVLLDLKDLAQKTDCDTFADVFQKAYDTLMGEPECAAGVSKIVPPGIPEEHQRVFAAMGSWNDSPPYLAREKGREEEYEALSDALLREIRTATMYATNQW